MGGKKHTIQKKKGTTGAENNHPLCVSVLGLIKFGYLCKKCSFWVVLWFFSVCGYVAAVKTEEVHKNMFLLAGKVLQEDATALKQNNTKKVPSEGFKGQRA